MRMSTKIFTIVCILILLSIAICAVGIFSLESVNTAILDMNNQSNRIMKFEEISNLVQECTINEKNMIIANSQTEIDSLYQRMKSLEGSMDKALKEYNDLKPTDGAHPEFSARAAKVAELWQAFSKATEVVADFAVQNTNNKAIEIYNRMNPLFDDFNAKTARLTEDIKRASADNNELLFALSTMETKRYRLQKDIAEFIAEDNAENMKKQDTDIRNDLANIQKSLDWMETTVKEQTKPQISDLKKIATAYTTMYTELAPFSFEDTNGRSVRYSNTVAREARQKIVGFIEETLIQSRENMAILQQNVERMANNISWFMGIISAAVIVIISLVSWKVVSGISGRLNNIIGNLNSGASHVNDVAAVITSTSQSLAEGSTEQAASLEETSSALEEMASMTRQNADNANKTNETTQHTMQIIGEGAVAVRNMSQAMSEISDSAEKISRIIKTIEDIAFQTNLLALNAAVEAARAGEAGKGFAVVADEVRNLAQRSAQAARDTTELIEGTVTRVKNGGEIAATLEESFKDIESEASSVGRLIQEITAATNEQAQGVDQVNTAVAQMDKVTQQTAANAEESASEAEKLANQAHSLHDMVAGLIELVEGKKGGVPGKQQPRASAKNIRREEPRQRTVPGGRPVSSSHAHQKSLPAPESSKVMKPSDIIPLDDEDFKDF